MIVVVTASRHVAERHEKAVRHALLWATGAKDGRPGEGHALWEGAAVGGDALAYRLAHEDFGWDSRRFPAEWSVCEPEWVDPIGKAQSCNVMDQLHRRFRQDGSTSYCPTAGFRRNQKMVDALKAAEGRKVVVGFPIPSVGSRGTIDCLTRALHAGLPVISLPLT